MARSYHLTAASLAIECPAKWLDNLLSHFHVPGVSREQRGVSRRIAPDAMLIILVTRLLVSELRVPVGRALALAIEICRNTDGRIVLHDGLELVIDLTRMHRQLEHRLLDVVETTVPARRGRPPLVDGRRRV